MTVNKLIIQSDGEVLDRCSFLVVVVVVVLAT